MSPICMCKKYTLISPSGITDAVYPACSPGLQHGIGDVFRVVNQDRSP